MAALVRTESLGEGPTTPTLSSKPLLGASASQVKNGRTPRIDLESVYVALKATVGENWNLYRESLGLYTLGRLNQEELALRIDPFIYQSATITHLHNQFLAGIYSNSLREPPEAEVATFVSAHDKLGASGPSKQVSGDAAEQRLKTEIMALPARERHRLKQLAEGGVGGDAFQNLMREIRDDRSIRPPDVVPASAGGFNKTNWELEIGKRFELPLFWESNEFPDAEMIEKRMVPICYQEGLAGGCNNGCADLVNVAAEAFIKQLLSECFGKVRSNGANYIKTNAFRRKLEREEDKVRKGEIKRDAYGLLPVEAETERVRTPFGVEELRFSLMMGNTHAAQNRILAAKVFNRALARQENKDLERKNGARRLTNGHTMTNGLSNGVNGWQKPPERSALDDVLDEVLDIGS